MEIDKKILDKTVHCKRNFSCINNDTHVFCKVLSCINKGVYFIECEKKVFCDYRMPFGKSYVCICPTRKAIFDKYKK